MNPNMDYTLLRRKEEPFLQKPPLIVSKDRLEALADVLGEIDIIAEIPGKGTACL